MSNEQKNNRYINTINTINTTNNNLIPVPKEKAKRKNAKDEINNNHINNNNNKDEKKSFENKISEQNNNKDIKAQNSEGKIYHSKSIKENGEKGKSKQKENDNKTKISKR